MSGVLHIIINQQEEERKKLTANVAFVEKEIWQ